MAAWIVIARRAPRRRWSYVVAGGKTSPARSRALVFGARHEADEAARFMAQSYDGLETKTARW